MSFFDVIRRWLCASPDIVAELSSQNFARSKEKYHQRPGCLVVNRLAAGACPAGTREWGCE